MKRFIVTLLLGLLFSTGVILAQTSQIAESPDYAAQFATFASVVALAAVLTEAIKKLFKNPPSGWGSRLLSWGIGIVLGIFAWVFHLGMFDNLFWWQALLWGFASGLAANGAYDTGLIEWLFSLFTKKKDEDPPYYK